MAPPVRTMSAWSYRHWVTHAEILASVRHSCTTQPQLEILDLLIRRLVDVYQNDAPVSFDPDWFCHKAKFGWYRKIPHPLHDQGENP